VITASDGAGDATDLPLVSTGGDDAPDPEPRALLEALRAARGNVKRTAADLGISRGRLYRLMERNDAIDLDAIRRFDRG